MKWKTLQHNGILFPPAYEAHGIKIKIKGENVDLNLNQEEMVYQWAKKKDTPYAQDKVFQKNFTDDFAKTLPVKFKNISYQDIDFSHAYKIIDKEKDLREMMTKEEKKALALKRKELREKLVQKYGKAIMDGKEVDVANYMAEPPGIFIGRGDHPLRGRWKPRVTAKDVTLNLGKEAKVPEGNWGKIVHDNDSMWLAGWTDYLTEKRKYVWLADTAGLKQDRDKAKYEKAVKLSKEIEKIKERIVKDMKSKDPKISRISTVCYLIYRTAMRVGDEKDPDEADTVGATTLRKEHINITENTIEFDFLGKDSVRWQETVKAEGNDKQFQENLKKLIQNKKPKDEIFEDITSRHVNAYYSSIVNGLTAKVFRTYLATTMVKDYLKEHDNIKGKTPNEKLYHAKLANLEAAIMCNHKRTIPKTYEDALQKKRETLKNIAKDQPWKKTMEALKKAEAMEANTDAQKKNKAKKVKTLNEQIKKQKEKHNERAEKLQLQIDLSEKTKDYNLGTSLRNYIDPRIFKAWTNEVGVEWEKLYTAALQKKFLWVQNEKVSWSELAKN
ncbi:MAG: DNA topoisomerase I [Nitrosarchaeum sp.]|jgi:DNA topoisomerase-1|uniref:DNA topoisomerase I n=1 Tax=Nitrosarchaeum sp. TaxID=2026886 RepID=UPI002DE28708|nr:DNA topoisomerase I [Nitrosarchaeum sp.]